MSEQEIPDRQIRATFDARTITVYQAYGDAIADEALAAQTFVAPFKRERMTWIKPSFLWMMYRAGWVEKPVQERILALKISREDFHWALAHASLSHFDHNVHESQAQWLAQKNVSPVRVQWDPERAINLERLAYRSIQIGLSGLAVEQHVDTWIEVIDDVTDLAREIHRLVQDGHFEAARAKLPVERTYPLSPDLVARIGASQVPT